MCKYKQMRQRFFSTFTFIELRRPGASRLENGLRRVAIVAYGNVQQDDAGSTEGPH